ncbi:hypothetical protein ACIQGZ_17055 [Streptomyces sp. NPDC092296]|uniref:hypothetical protein n=1 Tax=Streptomyces sp. NPDC092296 TaxID=3366012 RepID=UPI0038078CAF
MADLTKSGEPPQLPSFWASTASLRPYLPDRHTLALLGSGSVLLVHRIWSWITASGWRSTLDRIAVIGGCSCVAAAWGRHAVPILAPAAGTAWFIAALIVAPARQAASRRAARGEPRSGRATAGDAPDSPQQPSLAALVRELIGSQKGVHLSVLYPAIRGRVPALAEATDRALRDALAEAGIPVRQSIRVGALTGRTGVHVDDLPSPGPQGGARDGVERHVERA